MRTFNLFDGALDESFEGPGFRGRETRVATHVGASAIGGSLYELAPGDRLWPYHFHHANEEWLLVVAGRPTLREPDGERQLAPGDVVAFPAGAEGAHQFRNDGAEVTRLLVLSTLRLPDVVEYPDSGKVGVRAKGVRYNVAREPELDYWEGEG